MKLSELIQLLIDIRAGLSADADVLVDGEGFPAIDEFYGAFVDDVEVDGDTAIIKVTAA